MSAGRGIVGRLVAGNGHPRVDRLTDRVGSGPSPRPPGAPLAAALERGVTLRLPPSPVVRYSFAVGVCGLALVGATVFHTVMPHTLLGFFYGAVAVSAYYGGLGPGLLTTVMSVLTVDYLMTSTPLGLSALAPHDVGPLISFGFVAALMSTLSGVLYAARDRAERRGVELALRTEEAEAARLAAEQANRAKTEFLAVMSHELRTPLNAIAGYAELIDMGLRGPVTEQQHADLARLRRSQRYLLALINDVLNLAKIEAGHADVVLGDVRVSETLRGVEALVEPQMRAKEIAYDYIECAPDVIARADVEKVRQVLLNLLSNAIKFTNRGGRITISCEVTEGFVSVRVEDTGRGIPGDKLDIIFEPFVQVDQQLTRTQEGAGLGLAISRDLAEAMGGGLVATSVVGAGSTFTLTLPLSLADTAREREHV
ncbi:MAG TPA: ATP-binding protein [Gemmatimonadaceae bacterium]|nr:ATP-binding protein [Gemmatimonadaceae bacterium]